MSINHRERIEAIVKAALKRAVVNEPFGFYVAPTIVPAKAPNGMAGLMPSWLVCVSMRDVNNIGGPDLTDGDTIVGSLPPDDAFEDLAAASVSRIRKARQMARQATIALGSTEFQKALTDGRG